MKKYEYKVACYSEFSGRPLEAGLNKLGAEGWQLVTTRDIRGVLYYIFMRELVSPNPQQQVDV